MYLVFEFMDYDLGGLLNKNVEFTVPEIKCLAKQLFGGLHYLAVNKILHRDLKVANILLNRRGILKIADFGASAKSDGGKGVTLACRPLLHRPRSRCVCRHRRRHRVASNRDSKF